MRESCEASLQALGVEQLDMLLLHTPDPRTPLATSVRALATLQREGLVAHIGLSNVSLAELEGALALAPIAAVQLALGAFDDGGFRSGVVKRCFELCVEVQAHSPLGGPKRSSRLSTDAELVELADKYGTSPGAIVLAWLYGLSDRVVALPGARRPETARQAAQAAELRLAIEDRDRLDARFAAGARAAGRGPPPAPLRRDAEIVLVMGIQAAGKSSAAGRFSEQGYERLNRDQRGGTLKKLAAHLEQRLQDGVSHFVLDNTYLTRASRSEVLDVARAHGVRVRCVWVDTPLPQAQVNAVRRLLERYGELPDPDRLRTLGKKDPNAFAPTVQFRSVRQLEAPAADEGFAEIERHPFPGHDWGDAAGVIVAEAVLDRVSAGELLDRPVLVIAWAPGAAHTSGERHLEDRVLSLVRCVHGAGPPRCWCRPPLPGLVIPWLLAEGIDPRQTVLIGDSSADRQLAATLGARYDARSS